MPMHLALKNLISVSLLATAMLNLGVLHGRFSKEELIRRANVSLNGVCGCGVRKACKIQVAVTQAWKLQVIKQAHADYYAAGTGLT